MKAALPGSRVPLSYQGVDFRRTLVSLAIVVTAYMVRMRYTYPRSELAGGPDVRHSPADILLTVVYALVGLYCLFEFTFVLNYRFFARTKSFDAEHLYITGRRKEVVIPLDAIVAIKPTDDGKFSSTRGEGKTYRIGYMEYVMIREVELIVYPKMGEFFSEFCQLVERKNSSVEIKFY